MKKLIIILAAFFLVFTSCDTTDPKPPEEKPPGYQEDIPWPSLADSPWPMYQHDPQLTGRSPFEGPKFGIVSKVMHASQMQAGITLGYGSTHYFTAAGRIICANYDGTRLWENWLASEIFTTPCIAKDSTIYFSSSVLKTVYAIKTNGDIKWQYRYDNNLLSASLGIDKSGKVYFCSVDERLNVLTKQGELLWYIKDERINFSVDLVFSFAPEGDVIYVPGKTVSILAIDIPTRKVKWTFGDKKLESGAPVDNEGNIYVFPRAVSNEDNYFYSVKPSGEIRWKFKHEENDFTFDNLEPTIDKYGNIYFGYHKIYSLNNFGKLRWAIDLKDEFIVTSIISDSNGSIIICTSKSRIISFDNNGNINWELQIQNEGVFQSGGSITENGTLYIPTFRSDNYFLIK